MEVARIKRILDITRFVEATFASAENININTYEVSKNNNVEKGDWQIGFATNDVPDFMDEDGYSTELKKMFSESLKCNIRYFNINCNFSEDMVNIDIEFKTSI